LGRHLERDDTQFDESIILIRVWQKALIEQPRALEEHQMVSRQASAGNSQGID
jgi:hypothetical protein